jgi:hypothetical protein
MKHFCIPRPAPDSLHNDTAVSTLIGVIVMVNLVVLLTVILSAFLVGSLPQKTAYFVADAQYSIQNGYPVVTLVHRAGDTGYLSGPGTGHSLAILVTSGGSTITAVPDPAGLRWSPGTTLFITRSGSGYTVTSDPARIQGTPQAFPGRDVTVSVLDTGGNILVYQKTLTTT